MEHIEVSAPGKLVLFGEYAVLFGAPAVVAAMDRRAVVSLDPSSGDRWEISAPGLVRQPSRFEIAPGGAMRWLDAEHGSGAFGLVERLFSGIAGSSSFDLERLRSAAMILDTKTFFEGDEPDRTKLGLGSSAALTVALVTALRLWSGDEGITGEADQLRRLVDLHRWVQGGAGSGIDIAASLLGGVIRYQLAADGSVADASPVDLPGDMRMIFVWTGRSASTGDFLNRLRVRREEVPRVVNRVLEDLASVSSAGASAMATGDSEDFLDSVDAFWEALEKLGTAIDMPILSAEHRLLRQLAIECGVRYKPSGAGGGDFGIGFSTNHAANAELSARAHASGFKTVDLGVDESGVATLPA
jgi:phosphomevalonate kinase